MSQYFDNDVTLKDKKLSFYETIKGEEFSFVSNVGVFSKNDFDDASKILIETFIDNYNNEKKGLDVGCGVGVMGISLAKILDINIDMIDVNLRALELCKENARINSVEKLVNIFESDCYKNVNEKYDFIITNPPIRAGKKIVYDILFNAFEYLNDNGSLWLVIRKKHGALSCEKDLLNKGFNVDTMYKSKGIFVFCVNKKEK